MMHLRRGIPVLLALILLDSGCGKLQPASRSEPARAPTASSVAPPKAGEVLATLHWAGTQQITADTNGAVFKGILAMPESARLDNQVLDKLSVAPWSLLSQTVDARAARLLRLLLQDVFQRESFLEIRQATNEPGRMVFAIRLDEARASLWETNLAAVLESLTGARPAALAGSQHGWTLRKQNPPQLLELARAGEWTVFGAAQDRNTLLEQTLDRIQRDPAAIRGDGTNAWLEADLDLPRIASAFSLDWNLPKGFPRISFETAGLGTNVWTHGSLRFPQPLSLELDPWNIPTNFIDASLVSFTCVRGVKPWLASLKSWKDLQIGQPPNQLFFWAMRFQPMQSYFAAPLHNASDQVRKLTDLVMENNERLFGSDGARGFRRTETTNGVEWNGIPYLWPYFQSVETPQGGFILGGLFLLPDPEVIPSEMIPKAMSRTNLLYHDWELTGVRIEQWVFMGQFMRFAFQKPQIAEDSASLSWIRNLEPKMKASVTDAYLAAPDRISFERFSTLGLTGLELNLLADWLDSPRFPQGFHTLLAPPLVSP
jgi:hypothetical protein